PPLHSERHRSYCSREQRFALADVARRPDGTPERKRALELCIIRFFPSPPTDELACCTEARVRLVRTSADLRVHLGGTRVVAARQRFGGLNMPRSDRGPLSGLGQFAAPSELDQDPGQVEERRGVVRYRVIYGLQRE